MRPAALPLCFLLAAPALPAAEATFAFTNFASARGLSLVRDARLSSKVLRLTPSKQFRRGAAWFTARQPVAGGFETTFQFRLTRADRSFRGADGLAFVVESSGTQAIGAEGAAGGFARSDATFDSNFVPGIPRSLAVFFDTYKNPWDPSGNYLAICANGGVPDRDWPPRCLDYSQPLPVDVKDGKVHTARIKYEPPRISVFLDDLAAPVRTAAVDVAAIVGSDAYAGFTASTGGGHQNHDVLNWSFTGGPNVSSTVSVVTSNVSFVDAACLPGRTLCTPEHAVIEEKGPGRYHVYLPAHLEWGASIPNASRASVRVLNAAGVICWDPRIRNTSGCNGPAGNGIVPGLEADGLPGFLAPDQPAGALILRTRDGRTWFSVNDRTGPTFGDNEGYFEFDVVVGPA